MTVRVFFDTNVLVYALDAGEPEKRELASALILEGFATQGLVLSVQTLAECYRVLAIKRRLVPRAEAAAFVSSFQTRCTAPYDLETLQLAQALESVTGFQWFDCVMLASAKQARAHFFLSEDMTDGRDVDGVRIVNPFRAGIRTFDQLH
jgi:predicted nucleic acid-binding protein